MVYPTKGLSSYQLALAGWKPAAIKQVQAQASAQAKAVAAFPKLSSAKQVTAVQSTPHLYHQGPGAGLASSAAVLLPSSQPMADKQTTVAVKKGIGEYLEDITSFAGKLGGALSSIQNAFGGGTAPPPSPAPAAPAPGAGVVLEPAPSSPGAPPAFASMGPFLLLGGGALALVLLLRR